MILIAGMHRSGTSAVSRLLNLLGVYLGEELLEPKEGVNAAGFWENEIGVEINEALFGSLDSEWFDYLPWPDRWWEKAPATDFLPIIRSFVRNSLGGRRLVGVKDPRLCRLLPLWHAAAAAETERVSVVLPFRHPDEVAESLFKRDCIPHEAGYFLWLTYQLDAQRYSERLPHIFVPFDALFEDWKAVAQRIAEVCGVSWQTDPSAIEDEIADEIRPELRHRAPSGLHAGSSKARELALGVFEEMNTASEAGRTVQFDSARGEYHRLLDAAGTQPRIALEAMRRMIEARQELMSLGGEHAYALEVVNERDRTIEDLNAEISKRIAENAEREQELVRKRERLDVQWLRLRELRDRVRDQDTEIRGLKGRLAELENHWLWRWYRRLRH